MDQRGPAESWAGAGADLGRITIGDYALLQITALYGPLKLTAIATDNQCMLQSHVSATTYGPIGNCFMINSLMPLLPMKCQA